MKIMSKHYELYKQKEAILNELNKLPNKQRDYKEYYKIHYWTNDEYRKIKIVLFINILIEQNMIKRLK